MFCKGITSSLQNIFSEEDSALFTAWHVCVFSCDWKPGRAVYWGNLPLNIKTEYCHCSLTDTLHQRTTDAFGDCYRLVQVSENDFIINAFQSSQYARDRIFIWKRMGALLPVTGLMHQIQTFTSVLTSMKSENSFYSVIQDCISQHAWYYVLPLSRICFLHLGKCSNSSVI